MPAKDKYHNAVCEALEKDGWKITHDPLRVFWQGKVMFVDLGAEPIIAAEKEHQQIAVEIKTFSNPDAIHDIHTAAGQYIFYRAVLRRIQPNRVLFLAIPKVAFESLFDEAQVGEVLLQDEQIRLFIYEPETKEIIRWLEP